MSRLRRIEKKASEVCACPCGGSKRVQIWIGDKPKPKPCPKCGMPGKIIHIIRAEDPREAKDRPEVA